jgi:hypothetical protein
MGIVSVPLVSAVRECSTPSAVESPLPAMRTPAAVQLVLPITVVLVGDAAGVAQMLKQRRYPRPACHARAQQLEINLQTPAHHPPKPKCQPPTRCRPCQATLKTEPLPTSKTEPPLGCCGVSLSE